MKVVAQNRRARFDYEILETVEAGLQLSGGEAKACRMGHVHLAGAYVSFHGGIPMLKNATISPYPYSAPDTRLPEDRDRVLLLKKREAEKLQKSADEKGIAIIPLEMHAGKYIKILLGLGRGRKTIDKRARIKEKDVQRKMRRGEEI